MTGMWFARRDGPKLGNAARALLATPSSGNGATPAETIPSARGLASVMRPREAPLRRLFEVGISARISHAPQAARDACRARERGRDAARESHRRRRLYSIDARRRSSFGRASAPRARLGSPPRSRCRRRSWLRRARATPDSLRLHARTTEVVVHQR